MTDTMTPPQPQGTPQAPADQGAPPAIPMEPPMSAPGGETPPPDSAPEPSDSPPAVPNGNPPPEPLPAPDQAPAPDTGAPTEEGPDDAASGEKAEGEDKGVDIPINPDQKKANTPEEKIRQIADSYVIPISDSSIAFWAKADKAGDKFKDYAIQIASGLYPTFAAQIQMGLPTNVLLDPYIQVAQQVLGTMMSEPNWSDPKWGMALQGGLDPKTGRPVPMQLDQWRKALMSHPDHGWDKTPQAQERANQFVQALNQGFSGGQSS